MASHGLMLGATMLGAQHAWHCAQGVGRVHSSSNCSQCLTSAPPPHCSTISSNCYCLTCPATQPPTVRERTCNALVPTLPARLARTAAALQ